ncbi:MAG: reverse transcriptase domain-containing protein [Acidiferrobacterales bacterium]
MGSVSTGQIKRRSAGVDQESIEKFEARLGDNLYTLWNRLSSGSYFPPPVKGVAIPKKSGGVRLLGVPTVTDRVAQTMVKLVLEPMLEPVFHCNSYGYRPGRSAHDALAMVRRRNWEYDWVIEFDIKGLLGSLDHGWLLRFVEHRVADPLLISLIRRWLKASILEDGEVHPNEAGTPQGGSISVLLSNLYLHYSAPAQIWCFQRVKFPPRQEVQPPHRESSLGSEEVTNRTK